MSVNIEEPDDGDRVDGECGAPGSAEAHLEAAEAKLERAQEEREKADRDEREAHQEIREAQEELREEHREIRFSVDGEDYKTKQDEWTPNNILREFPKLDPATHYLVELTGKTPISYKGKGDIPIKLHDCEAFQAISEGPTPVSDGQLRTGVSAFLDGLRKLGYSPTQLKDHLDHVVIDYVVPVGKYVGKTVKHGFIVPPDFPVTPPSGPHVTPHIHRIQPQGQHPIGGVHETHAAKFAATLGGAWQYWSRPFPEWPKSSKTAAAYMGHVYRLWATQ
jgi:hypothetical protein